LTWKNLLENLANFVLLILLVENTGKSISADWVFNGIILIEYTYLSPKRVRTRKLKILIYIPTDYRQFEERTCIRVDYFSICGINNYLSSAGKLL